jgi:hypothetical protein
LCIVKTGFGRKVKQVLSGSWYQWERVGYREGVKEGE